MAGDRKLYAVLIDADNIPAKFAEAIIKEVTAFGEPALRRVYGDWGHARLKGWSEKIRDLGLVAHQETSNTTGKNASDIGLVIDAMDILHTGNFDGFVLVSSDSDFTRLAARVRESGLEVIGIGEEKTPGSLKAVCNRFVTLENIAEEPQPRPGKTPAKTEAAKKRNPTEAVPLILRAMDKINQDDEWYNLGTVGKQIMMENSDFDTRSYGEKKLSDLVKKLKRFETRKEGNHLTLRRVD